MCNDCKFYSELEKPMKIDDDVSIYGYCFKDPQDNHDGYPVYLPQGTCKDKVGKGDESESNYKKTHLCGGIYSGENEKCECLLYATKEGQVHGKKALKRYHVYCTAEGRCRSMGCAASWTGCSPKWCPKRKEREAEQ